MEEINQISNYLLFKSAWYVLTFAMNNVLKMRINDWNNIVSRNKNKFYPKILLCKIQEGLILLVFAVMYYMRIFKMRHTIKESNHNFNAIHINNQTASFLYHFQPYVAALGNFITLHSQLPTTHAVFSVLWNHPHSPSFFCIVEPST